MNWIDWIPAIVALITGPGLGLAMHLLTRKSREANLSKIQTDISQSLSRQLADAIENIEELRQEVDRLKRDLFEAQMLINHLREKLKVKDAEIATLRIENHELLARLQIVERKTGDTGPLKGADNE